MQKVLGLLDEAQRYELLKFIDAGIAMCSSAVIVSVLKGIVAIVQ
jgi:hypothetical protein